MLLAQITPEVSQYAPPPTIGQWLECLFWFAAFIGAVIGIAKMLKFKPAMHEYVLITEFNKRMDGMSSSSKEFRDGMRIEQKDIGDRLARVETRLECQDDKLDHMDAKLDRLIERPS